MTGIGLISRRYAKALAEYSAGLGEEAVVYGQLLPLTQRYDYVPAVREAVGPCRCLQDFIRLVLRHRREAYLYFIIHSYVELYRERHHLKEAMLVTAVPLGDGVTEMVRSRMQERSGCTVNVTAKVDPSIIGGFVFRMEDTLLDASVASQLRLLRRRLGSNPVRKI